MFPAFMVVKDLSRHRLVLELAELGVLEVGPGTRSQDTLSSRGALQETNLSAWRATEGRNGHPEGVSGCVSKRLKKDRRG